MFSLLFACAFEAVESACDVKRYTKRAYYDNGQYFEKCSVYVYACRGNCDNSYSFGAHKDGSYSSVDSNCNWLHKACKVQYSNAYASAELFNCAPVDPTKTTQFDVMDPWTVTIYNATGCHCGSTTASSGVNDCPKGYRG